MVFAESIVSASFDKAMKSGTANRGAVPASPLLIVVLISEGCWDGGGVAGENITVHHVPLAGLRQWFADQESAGKLIDCKIHAALWLAGIRC